MLHQFIVNERISFIVLWRVAATHNPWMGYVPPRRFLNTFAPYLTSSEPNDFRSSFAHAQIASAVKLRPSRGTTGSGNQTGDWGPDWAPTVFNDNLLSYVFLNIISLLACRRRCHNSRSAKSRTVQLQLQLQLGSAWRSLRLQQCNTSHQGHSHGISLIGS